MSTTISLTDIDESIAILKRARKTLASFNPADAQRLISDLATELEPLSPTLASCISKTSKLDVAFLYYGQNVVVTPKFIKQIPTSLWDSLLETIYNELMENFTAGENYFFELASPTRATFQYSRELEPNLLLSFSLTLPVPSSDQATLHALGKVKRRVDQYDVVVCA